MSATDSKKPTELKRSTGVKIGIVLFISVLVLKFIYSDDSVIVTSDKWTKLQVNPRRESFDLYPRDREEKFRYILVLNEDFEHPKIFRSWDKGDDAIDLGNGIETIHVTVEGDHGRKQEQKFVFKLIPKK